MSEAPNYGDDEGELPAPLFIGVSADQAGSVVMCVGEYEIMLTIKAALQISAKLIESAVDAGDILIPEHIN
jgi:hypothetical protein